jgi:tRNA(fMet)-specific endonuclease VapC
VSYLLDTNACIALLNGEPKQVHARLSAVHQTNALICVSSIVLFELWYGAHKSAKIQRNSDRLHDLLAGPVEVLPFDQDDAEMAGRIRADLARQGQPIGSYDVLIAGQALRHGYILVTANVSEFQRVKQLRWEDWSKP